MPYARAIRDEPRPETQSVVADLGWYSHDNDAILAGTWAASIGALGLPILRVQEGGYELGVIARNVVNVLRSVERL